MLNCKNCNLNNANQITKCTKLNTGKCSYKVITYSTKNIIYKGIIAFGIFWTLISSLFFVKIISQVKFDLSTVLFPFLFGLSFELIGFGVIFMGLYNGFAQRTNIYNPLTGESIKIIKLFEKVLYNSITTKIEPINKSFTKLGKLQISVSISSLSLKKDNNALYLFSVTLLYLISNDYLEIKKSKVFSAFLNTPEKFKKEEYFLFSGKKSKENVDGKLENMIMNVINNWHNFIEFRESPQAPSIYYLISSVFEKDRFIPQYWIIDLVGNDAFSKNMVNIAEEKMFKTENNVLTKYEPNKQYFSEMKSEATIIQNFYNTIKKTNPDFINALDKQITRAIHSRQESSD